MKGYGHPRNQHSASMAKLVNFPPANPEHYSAVRVLKFPGLDSKTGFADF